VQSRPLAAYVPRLVGDWLVNAPERQHRVVDGSLAFLDISGFTRLTERLARKGKVGAEEMSDALSATFSELLSVAYGDGADLVKWGGDAVLLLFEGDQHAARACRAAYRMRGSLREIGRMKTTSGPVTLRVSVGVHSGELHFFLVGDPASHRELLVAGPAASTTVAMESIANAGQICVSTATAAQLEPRVVRRGPDDSFLLRAEPDVLSEAPALPIVASPPDLADLGHALPPTIREHLSLQEGEAEHRAVTIAFVRFSGTDSLFASEGPEGVAAALDECVRNVQDATNAHDVTFFETDIDRDGGKFMLTAGAPRSSGHDSEHLLRAARSIVERAGSLSLQVGLNRGHVFSGDFGPPFRRTYSIKGDAVNLAARVMGKAQRGQVLATLDVMDHSSMRFDTRELPAFSVKGKTAAVHAVVVGPALGVREVDAADLLLIGRDDEMAYLDQALADANSRRGHLVDIVGEAGIGKSRLAEEVVKRTQNMVVLRAHCERYESGTPYFAFRRLLRQALAIPSAANPADATARLRDRVAVNAPHLVPWLPLLGIPMDIPIRPTRESEQLEERFRKTRLEELTCEFLHWVLPTPTVLVFEDAHLMDDASADLLGRLMRDLSDRPWLVLTTRRDQPSGFVPDATLAADTLRLGPLQSEAAVTLAEVVSDEAPLPPQALQVLARRAGGNPLFLRELVRAAGRSGALDNLPDSLEELVTHQIDALGPVDRTLLRYAAVLGIGFPEQMLRRMVPGGTGEALTNLASQLQGFLVEDGPGQLRFRHALLRDVAYEGLAYSRRRQLHALAGETVEQSLADPRTQPELLAWHYFQAGRFEKAWTYGRLAGERSRAKYAHVEAAESFERAVESGRRAGMPGVDLAGVLESLGDVRYLVGQAPEAGAAYRAARREVRGNPVREAELILKQARLLQRLGSYSETLRWLSRGMSSLDGVDDDSVRSTRSMLATRYAVCRISQGRYQDAAHWAQVGVAEAQAAADTPALAQAYLALHAVAVWNGEHQEVPYGERALALFEELDDVVGQAHCLNNLAMRAVFEGRWTAALEMFERAADSFRRVGDTTNAANAAYNQADLLIRQGRLDKAEALLKETSRVARAVHDEELAVLCMREYGRAASRGGRFAEAMEAFAEARARFVELGEPHEVVDTDAATAECLVLRGDWQEAYDLASDALSRANSLGAAQLVPALLRISGVALRQLGQLEGAREALAAGLHETDAPDVAHERGFLLLELAEVMRLSADPDAGTLQEEGEATLDALGVLMRPKVS
jgi:class 3 adenylate cyclase/tetratricopeptide (TPR) repeat protein